MTAQAARANNVVIGAHPSYPDPYNFGRKSMDVSNPNVAQMLTASLTEQITRLAEICADEGMSIAYVKPHGALYNDAVKSTIHADLIAVSVKNIDPDLILMGAPDSEMTCAAARHGLSFIAEGFIDRRYTDDGHLQSRSIDGAVIESQADRMTQARSLVTLGNVITASGKTISIRAESLCLHGDSAGAVETARQARAVIKAAGVIVKAFVT